MELCVPSNWQRDFVEAVRGLKNEGNITEVFSKLSMDAVGGGRAASALPLVSRREAALHIRALRDAGLRFNYLLNGLCLDNLELTRGKQRQLRSLMEWLVYTGAEAVTVSNPYLAFWIKRNYPSFSLAVSVHANVDTPARARFWEDLGADKITLPDIMVNRNFPLLRKLREAVKCRIQLLANCACLLECPTFINHALASCHASQKSHGGGGFIIDYYSLLCRLARLRDPVKFIRSSWIRPEDISLYEELGVDSIKLVDRRLATPALVTIISAYSRRSYDGNLIDLFPTMQGKSFTVHRNWFYKLRLLAGLPVMNPARVVAFARLSEGLRVRVDNKKLDGFLRGFQEKCTCRPAQACEYCRAAADKAIEIDGEYQRRMTEEIEKELSALIRQGIAFCPPGECAGR